MSVEALKRAIEKAGGQTKLAAAIGANPRTGRPITQGHISQWLQRSYVPPEIVIAIEVATGVSRHELRPDIYPEAAA